MFRAGTNNRVNSAPLCLPRGHTNTRETAGRMSDISGKVVMIRCANSEVLGYEGMEIDCEGMGRGGL